MTPVGSNCCIDRSQLWRRSDFCRQDSIRAWRWSGGDPEPEIDAGLLLAFGSDVQPEGRTGFVSEDARSGQRQSNTETTSSWLVVLDPNSAAVDVHGEAAKRKPKAV